LHVTWERSHEGAPPGPSGEAMVLGLDGERITLSSTIPRAPGGKLAGALESGSRLQVKVASCRKQGAVFTIEGRLLDATRALRAEIAALLPPGSGAPGPLRSSS
jgi:hypothetical protein